MLPYILLLTITSLDQEANSATDFIFEILHSIPQHSNNGGFLNRLLL